MNKNIKKVNKLYLTGAFFFIFFLLGNNVHAKIQTNYIQTANDTFTSQCPNGGENNTIYVYNPDNSFVGSFSCTDTPQEVGGEGIIGWTTHGIYKLIECDADLDETNGCYDGNYEQSKTSLGYKGEQLFGIGIASAGQATLLNNVTIQDVETSLAIILFLFITILAGLIVLGWSTRKIKQHITGNDHAGDWEFQATRRTTRWLRKHNK